MYKEKEKLKPDGNFGRKAYERVSGHVKSRIVTRILDEGLTFLYNGKLASSTPFHFSGLYQSFAIRFGNGMYR
ncbi:MAG TPA: hypothetical protein VGB84_05180 [Arachidicoccus sp.]